MLELDFNFLLTNILIVMKTMQPHSYTMITAWKNTRL
jgi:hypothetical protein